MSTTVLVLLYCTLTVPRGQKKGVECKLWCIHIESARRSGIQFTSNYPCSQINQAGRNPSTLISHSLHSVNFAIAVQTV